MISTIPALPIKLQLIGIHGHAGAGKDTIAKYLYTFYQNVYIEHFADPLKAAASTAFGIPLDEFNDPKTKNTVHPYWKVSPRQIAQFMGTEMFRDTASKLLPQVGNDFWVQRLAGKLSAQLLLEDEGEYQEGDTVVISDVRFQNEVDFIISNGGVIITVERSGYEGNVGIENHRSEAGGLIIPTVQSYKLFNNSTIPELFTAVEGILPSMRAVNMINLTHI
jgi:hypothetical protein